MALNIKNPEVERLAAEVAELAHETKTEAIRKALLERKQRFSPIMSPEMKKKRLMEFMEREIYPKTPKDLRGKKISQKRQDEILGYDEMGIPEQPKIKRGSRQK